MDRQLTAVRSRPDGAVVSSAAANRFLTVAWTLADLTGLDEPGQRRPHRGPSPARRHPAPRAAAVIDTLGWRTRRPSRRRAVGAALAASVRLVRGPTLRPGSTSVTALRQPKPTRMFPFRAQGRDGGYAPGGQRSPFPARTGCGTSAGTHSDARMAGCHALPADGWDVRPALKEAVCGSTDRHIRRPVRADR